MFGLSRSREPTPEPWAPTCPHPYPLPPSAHSPMQGSILGFFLVAGAEVHQRVQVRLEKHVPQPGHVAPEGRRTQETHDPPVGRHDRKALVGDRCEGHHNGQLSLGVILAAFQEGSHILIHLWSNLELVWELQESGTELSTSPTGLFPSGVNPGPGSLVSQAEWPYCPNTSVWHQGLLHLTTLASTPTAPEGHSFPLLTGSAQDVFWD